MTFSSVKTYLSGTEQKRAKRLLIDGRALLIYLQTMKGLASGTKIAAQHRLRFYRVLKKEYEGNPAFREKINKAIEAYGPRSAIDTTNDVADKIIAMAREHKTGMRELKEEIAEKLRIDLRTVEMHIRSMRALTGEGGPGKPHRKGHYSLLEVFYENNRAFKDKINMAVDEYDKIVSWKKIEQIAEAIIKHAPVCRKGKVSVKEYVAEKTGTSFTNIGDYVQAMRALAGESPPPDSLKGRMYPGLEKVYEQDMEFRGKIEKALEIYSMLELKRKITYPELVAEARISLEAYKRKKPKEKKEAWARENMLKKVVLEAMQKLALSRKIGTNQLIAQAIRDAEK